MRFTFIKILLFLPCLLACSCKQEETSVANLLNPTSRFQAGQVWTFHTSSNDLPHAELTVARVDFDPKEKAIVYISVPPHRAQKHNFLPLSEDALNRSVVSLVRTDASLTSEEFDAFLHFYEAGRQGMKAGSYNQCFRIGIM